MADDILQVQGFLDFTNGVFNTEDRAVVTTASEDRIQRGWPDWSYRYRVPIDAEYATTFDNVAVNGSAKIYDGNPVAFLVKPGGFGVGSKGRITGLLAEWFGTFDEFTAFLAPSGSPVGYDPSTGAVRAGGGTGGGTAPTGDMTTAWSQFGLSVIPPRNARFVVPSVGVGTSMPSGSNVYLDAFNLRVLSASDWTGTPGSKPLASYEDPRSLKIRVVPTRQNLSISPRLHGVDNAGAFVVGSPMHTITGGFSGNMSVDDGQRRFNIASVKCRPNASGKVTENQTLNVIAGTTMTYSLYYLSTSAITGVYAPSIRFLDTQGAQVSEVVSTQTITGNTRGDWTRVVLTVEVPQGAARAIPSPLTTLTTPSSQDTFWVAGVLLEPSAGLSHYFDGASGNDYLWDQKATLKFAGQSYYYEDRQKRTFVMNRAVSKNLPLGMAQGAPVFALGTNAG